MKSRPCIWMSFACLAAALTITIQVMAQDNAPNDNQQPRYRLIEVGTFGGPDGSPVTGPPSLHLLTDSGIAVGLADTAVPDPYPYCWVGECYVTHGFQWQNGVLTNLGALPGTNSSAATGVNELGVTVAVSENGSLDPLTGYPEYDGVIWKNGMMTDLGTLGGNLSYAIGVNDLNQVVGGAENAIPDDYDYGFPCVEWNCWPAATQWRAFLWQNGRMRDLGTLGGNDAFSMLVNDLGQVAGISYTDTTPNPTTGVPTLDPFFWQNGRMIDMGTLGSGHYSYPNGMNLFGQTVGDSAPADTWYHAFLWQGGKMQDLGLPLGGDFSIANWINDFGQTVGDASLPGDQAYHAVLWSQGRATDLGVVSGDGCSYATSINLTSQVVGDLANCSTGEDVSAFLWQNGTMYDLNSLIPPGSGLTIFEAFDINDVGQIECFAVLANGNVRACLLTPCNENDPAGCQNQVISTAQSANNPAQPRQQLKPWRDPMARFRAPIYSQ
jgi:probable HAF family extracellular repeat protein